METARKAVHRSGNLEERSTIVGYLHERRRLVEEKLLAPVFPTWHDDTTRQPSPSERLYCGDIEVPRSATKLEAMIGRETKPKCKLELWTTLAKRYANSEADLLRRPSANYHHRLAFVEDRRETTLKEIDTKVAALHARGAGLTVADVSQLMRLMTEERNIERSFGVTLTAIAGERPDGSQIAWTQDELRQVAIGLAALPPTWVRDNPWLMRIERGYRHPEHPEYRATYDADAKQIVIYDRDSLAIAAAAAMVKPGFVFANALDADNNFSDDLAHEIGHIQERVHLAAYQEFEALGGWQWNVSDEQLQHQAKFDRDTIDRLKSGSIGAKQGKDSLIYQPDLYVRDQVTAHKSDAVPESDPWNYARKNPKEFWSELIAQAALNPAQVNRDMIDAPAAAVDQAVRNRRAAEHILAKALHRKWQHDIIGPLIDDVADRRTAETHARATQQLRLKELNVIRRVYQADAAARAAVHRLRAQGVPQATVAQFLGSTQRLATPALIDGFADWVLSSAAALDSRLPVPAAKPRPLGASVRNR